MCDLYCLPVVLVECAVADTRMDISSRLHRSFLMWSEVWFTKNAVEYGLGHSVVNHLREGGLGGESEFLDLSGLGVVDTDEAFIAAPTSTCSEDP